MTKTRLASTTDTAKKVITKHGENISGDGAPSQVLVDPKPLAAFILAGKTGSGKSSFIKLLGGLDLDGEEPTVSDNINSCTQKPTAYMTMLDGRRILLLDTPGFDDSGVENITILNDIVAKLYDFARHQHKIETRGVIFLHDISEKRFSGSQRKTLEILKALCGPKGMENCIIGTTMWSDPGSQKYQSEEAREGTFLREHWQGVLKTVRVPENDTYTAITIINDILARPSVLLLVQEEMLKPPNTLESTTVGKIAIPEGRAEANEVRKKFQDFQRQAREIAEAQEAEYNRKKEEERAQFEAELVKQKEEAQRVQDEWLRQDKERQEREEEDRKLRQEEMLRVAVENRRLSEAEANRARQAERRRYERKRQKWERLMKKRLDEHMAQEAERRREFEKEQERLKRELEKEKKRVENIEKEIKNTTTEPGSSGFLDKVLSFAAFAIIVTIGISGGAAAAVAAAAVVTTAVQVAKSTKEFMASKANSFMEQLKPQSKE